jgi:hypothetical protein
MRCRDLERWPWLAELGSGWASVLAKELRAAPSSTGPVGRPTDRSPRSGATPTGPKAADANGGRSETRRPGRRAGKPSSRWQALLWAGLEWMRAMKAGCLRRAGSDGD